MLNIDEADVKFAVETVREATSLVKKIQQTMVSEALTKGDRSPVTVADFASQALVARRLAAAYPNDPLLAEEDATALRTKGAAGQLEQVTQYIAQHIPEATPESVCLWIDRGKGKPAARFWTLDPIDGTKGFLRGDQYVVALALIEAGLVQVGVLGCPNLTDGYLPEVGGPGSLIVAVRNQGTWSLPLMGEGEPVRLRVSPLADPARARVLRSFEAGHTNVSQIDEFAQEMGITAGPVRMDSQAKYAVLAAGRGDLLLRLLSRSRPDYREKIWDQAAGSLVVTEAGGRITDLHGQELDFTAGRTLDHNRGILASNGQLHAAALDALRAITA